MNGQRCKKGIVLAVALVLLLGLVAWFGYGAYVSSLVDSTLYAAEKDSNFDELTLPTLNKWETFSYKNAPSWEYSSYLGRDVVSYELDTSKEEHYSMDASLISPYIVAMSGTYTFEFEYSTRMREETPNEITLSIGSDLNSFEEVGKVYCSDTSSTFRTSTPIEFTGSFCYLKIDIHVYYCEDLTQEPSYIAGGMYFPIDGLSLYMPKDSVELDSALFSFSVDKRQYTYDGEVHIPTLSMLTGYDASDYIIEQTVLPLDGQSADSIEVGAYTLSVAVKNRSNRVCFTKEWNYTVQKAKVALDEKKLDYFCNGKYVAIYGGLCIEDGRKLTEREKEGLFYFTEVGTTMTTSETNVIACPSSGTFQVGIGLKDSPYFENFTSTKKVEGRNNDCAYFVFDTGVDNTVETVYNGKAFEPYTKEHFFTAPTQKEESPKGEVKYEVKTASGWEKVAEAKNAGEYKVTLTYYENDYYFYLKINKRAITKGVYSGADIIKTYDGNRYMFDTETKERINHISDLELTLSKESEFVEEKGVCKGDEVGLAYSTVQYAREMGNTYLEPVGVSLKGKDCQNYYLSDDFYVESCVRILGDYYQYNETNGSYVPTEDEFFFADKQYYQVEATVVPLNDGDNVGGYYVGGQEGYFVTIDERAVNGKKYYTLTKKLVEKKIAVKIETVSPILMSDRDEKDELITVADREYKADSFEAGTVDKKDVLPTYGGRRDICYSDVAFYYLDNTVGKQELQLKLVNRALFDRYTEDIVTTKPVYGVVTPYLLTVDVEETMAQEGYVTGTTKVFDNTTNAFPCLNGLCFESAPVGFLSPTEYSIGYQSASYVLEDAGVRNITISGVTLNAYTRTGAEVLKNYKVDAFTIQGTIEKKELLVSTKYIRAHAKESLDSKIQTNAEYTDFDIRIFETEEKAQLGLTPMMRTEEEGMYYVRIDVRSGNLNYYIGDPLNSGYIIIPCEVAETQKIRQKICFASLDLSGGKEFVTVSGASFTLDAYSVGESNGYKTGLDITYTLSGNNDLVTNEGNTFFVSADKTGTFDITVSQSGNNYYYSAEDIVLSFRVDDNLLNAVVVQEPDTLYAYNALPVLADNIEVRYKDKEIKGTLTAPDGELSAGEKVYVYSFETERSLEEYLADFTIEGNYYVQSGIEYVLSEDTEYSPYTQYYHQSFTADEVTVGATVPHAEYYERQLVPTSDSKFLSGKSYYEANYAIDSTVTSQTAVPSNIYYEKEEGYYVLYTSSFFSTEHDTYYICTFKEDLSVTANAVIKGVYYEKTAEGKYKKVEEKYFIQGKTYYIILTATDGEVQQGTTVPSGTFYYYLTSDKYELTKDALFDEDKDYYKVVYTKSVVTVNSGIEGEYYEEGDKYFLTYDNVFADGKKYYLPVYQQVYFVEIGKVTSSNYFEKGEGDSYFEASTETFVSGTEYFRNVWTEDEFAVGAYEQSLPTLVKTTDTTFVKGKEYFFVLSDGIYTVGATLQENYWYEKSGEEYVLSSDTVFVNDKTYYYLSPAIIELGVEVKDKPYYEWKETTYFVTEDGSAQLGKKYYSLAKLPTVAVERGVMPSGEYYVVQKTYSQATDTYFGKDKIYYSLSYAKEEVSAGGHITDAYYTYANETYTKEEGRYFKADTVYFRAVYVPYDVISLRTIGENTIYFQKVTALDTYQENETYYRTPNEGEEGFVLAVDDTVVAGEAGDGKHYQKVTEEEFVQGKKYYYIGYKYIGRAPVSVSLTAVIPEVRVYTSEAITSEYNQSVDISSVMESIVLFDGEKETKLSYEKGIELLNENSAEFTLQLFAYDILSDMTPNTYVVLNNEQEVYARTSDSEYNSVKNYYFVTEDKPNGTKYPIYTELNFYEYDEDDKLVLTQDTVFSPFKDYFMPRYELKTNVAVGEFVDNIYYEKKVTDGVISFKKSSDAKFEEKEYYSLNYSAFTPSLQGVSIGFYEKNAQGRYLRSSDTFADGVKTYYLLAFTKVILDVGSVTSNGWFEKEDAEFIPVGGEPYEEVKTYYSITEKEGKTYKARTSLTLLGEFSGDTLIKNNVYTYYSYENALVSGGTLREGTYYEYTSGEYIATEDVYFVAGKNYYKRNENTFVASENGLSRYFMEKEIKNGKTYYNITSDTYADGTKTYYLPILSKIEVMERLPYLTLNTDSEEYTFVILSPEFTYTVTKANVVVTVGEFEKYYGEKITDELTLKQELQFENLPDSLYDTLRDNIDVIVYSDTFADSGEYLIAGQDKQNYSTGDLIPTDRDVYELSYVYTTDTAFERGKEYYRLSSYEKVDIIIGQTVLAGNFFEKKYVLTSDKTYQNKMYYSAPTYVEYNFKKGSYIPADSYYEADYFITTDLVFDSAKQYYLYDFVSEKDTSKNLSFYTRALKETEDAYFALGKKYFEYKYSEASIVAGRSVPLNYYYELTEKGYVFTKDEHFFDDKVYYTRALVEKAFTPFEKIEGEYYEYDYVLKRSDDPFETGVEYYVTSYIPVKTNGEEIKLGGMYYEHSYFVTTDSTFQSEKTYYYPVYSALETQIGVTVDGKVYEEKFVLVSDSVFLDNKTYYTKSYEKVSPTYGDEITPSTYFELNYAKTEDKNFIASKKYYYVEFVLDEGIVGEKIYGTKYKLWNEVYSVTTDETYQDGMRYYSLAYTAYSVYNGETQNTLSNRYTFEYKNGNLVVLPISLEVTSYTTGHNYGEKVAKIVPSLTVLSKAKISQSELDELTNQVAVGMKFDCSVTSDSDCGEYLITLVYDFADKNLDVHLISGTYVVRESVFNADPTNPAFVFNNERFLYDGKLHTLKVVYDKEKWKDVTITYDKGGFSEVGEYEYNVTIQQKNYQTLELTAKMTIGKITLESNNKKTNVASITILDKSCTEGVGRAYSVVLTSYSLSDEAVKYEVDELLKSASASEYAVKGAYSVDIYEGQIPSSLPYSSYKVTIQPEGITYNKNILLFGYKDGVFQQLEFAYEDGSYTFEVSQGLVDVNVLGHIIFVQKDDEGELTETEKTVNWIMVAIIAIGVIAVIGLLIDVVAKANRSKARARKRKSRYI